VIRPQDPKGRGERKEEGGEEGKPKIRFGRPDRRRLLGEVKTSGRRAVKRSHDHSDPKSNDRDRQGNQEEKSRGKEKSRKRKKKVNRCWEIGGRGIKQNKHLYRGKVCERSTPTNSYNRKRRRDEVTGGKKQILRGEKGEGYLWPGKKVNDLPTEASIRHAKQILGTRRGVWTLKGVSAEKVGSREIKGRGTAQ